MDTLYARQLMLASLLALSACSDSDDSFNPTPVIPEETLGPSATLDLFGLPEVPSHYREDSVAPPSRMSGLTVLQPDGESGHPGDSGAVGYDDVAFSVDSEGQYRFCVDGSANHDHWLQLLNDAQAVILEVFSGKCEDITLDPGHFIKRVYHGEALLGLVFVSREAESSLAVSARAAVARKRQNSISTAAVSSDVVLRRMRSRLEDPITTFRINAGGCPDCYLSGISLSDVDLSGFNFERAHFDGASLDRVDFSGANLRQASFAHARLDNVKFNGADMRGADFNKANSCGVGSAIDCRVEWLGANTGPFEAPDTPLIGAGDITHASTYEYQGTRRGWAYLLIVGQDADGNLYNKSWDHKGRRGWSGWRKLPSLPNGITSVSQPTAYGPGSVGLMSVAIVGEDSAGNQLIYGNYRHITSGWNDWSIHGKPQGQRILSAPNGTNTRYASDRDTYYLAVLAQNSENAQAAPQIWLKRGIVSSGRWLDSPTYDSDTGSYNLVDLFPEWNAERCVASEGRNEPDRKPWCPLAAPEGQRFASAPVLARVGYKEAKLTVLMESGELWEYGLGEWVLPQFAGWRKVDLPSSLVGHPFVVESAPAASNLGFSRTDSEFALSIIGTETRELQELDGADVFKVRRIYIGKRDRYDEQYQWTSRAMGSYNTSGMLAMSDYGFERTVYTITTGAEVNSDETGLQFGFNLSSGDTWENLGFPGSQLEAAEPVDLTGATLQGLVTDADFTTLNTEGMALEGADLTRATLSGALFEEASIRDSNLTGVDLSNTSLSAINLRGSSLRGANLDNTDLSWSSAATESACDTTRYDNSNFGTCLYEVDLTGASLKRAVLDGQDLRQTTLDASPIIEYPLPGAALTTPLDCGENAVGIEPDIERTRMRSTLFSANQLPPTLWRSLDLADAHIVDVGGANPVSQVDYSYGRMSGLILQSSSPEVPMDFSHSQFFGAVLDRADFSGGVKAAGSKFDNSCFRQASLRGLKAQDSSLRDVLFLAADMSSAAFDRSDLARAKFSGSILDGASFGSADLRYVDASSVGSSGEQGFLSAARAFAGNFNSAIMVGAKLRGARFNGQGEFPAANLDGALLANADLRDTDFTGARLDRSALYTDNRFGEDVLQLDNANFTAASFRGAYLQGVDFSGNGQAAVLTAVDLGEAFLVNATLKDVNLQAAADNSLGRRTASLSAARLEGVNLGDASLQGADLSGAQLCVEGVTPDDPGNPGAAISNCSLLSIDYSYQSLSDDLSERVLRRETVSPLLPTRLDGALLDGATCPSTARALDGSCEGELIAPAPPRTCPEPDLTSWYPQPC